MVRDDRGRGPHVSERESVAAALDYSLKVAAMHQRNADKELAEATKLQVRLDVLNEKEGEK